ncbi:hypothetical protein FE257_010839 [Aspergillus nanangensis]|uniref:Secreted protein n=1 Tax=Aspergillus nanangensis TaxID=2582783 RepID=A0AAD4CW30_ASPNN|nr:hypothetical protein FE257_010839 [Aspergillus nanangensis]
MHFPGIVSVACGLMVLTAAADVPPVLIFVYQAGVPYPTNLYVMNDSGCQRTGFQDEVFQGMTLMDEYKACIVYVADDCSVGGSETLYGAGRYWAWGMPFRSVKCYSTGLNDQPVCPEEN